MLITLDNNDDSNNWFTILKSFECAQVIKYWIPKLKNTYYLDTSRKFHKYKNRYIIRSIKTRSLEGKILFSCWNWSY